MAHALAKPRLVRKRLLFGLLVVAAFYVLLPQLGVFRHSFAGLENLRIGYLLPAFLFTALTYPAAATTYCLLALKKLRFGRTLLVQLASMFSNRLLPGGIGGIGTNYAYLRHARHSATEAASVVAANNLLGFVGHLTLVALTVGMFHKQLFGLHMPRWETKWGWPDVIALILLALLLSWLSNRYWRRACQATVSILRRLLAYRLRPLRLLGGGVSSIGLTLCNVLSLYYCVLALHISLSFAGVLVVFTLGIALGTATPTPGGLGGVEAGLVAGLVASHVPSSEALAAVLVYRLISYWLALVFGAAAFAISERRGYFSRV